MKKAALKENSRHGTPLFPLQVYNNRSHTDYHVAYHWHDELEFIYVEDGVIEATINAKTVKVNKGEFIFINSQDLHQVASTSPSIHHAIVFYPEILSFDYPDISQSTIIKPIINGELCFPSFLDFEDHIKKTISTKLINIIHTNESHSPLSSFRIKILLLEIISILFEEKLFLKSQDHAIEKPEKIKKVIAYIKSNYDQKIAIPDLAGLIHMNKNYFTTYFRQATGKTPVLYINEFRCEKAAELLKSSDLKVLDISLLVGFENFSYFIRKFKEHKRYSPGEYRKLMQE